MAGVVALVHSSTRQLSKKVPSFGEIRFDNETEMEVVLEGLKLAASLGCKKLIIEETNEHLLYA